MRCALVIGTVLLALAVAANAHLCMMIPHQRGAMDISTSGNPTCFHHNGPCGGVPSGPVTATYNAGDIMFVKFQQNYNHYAVGNPGWLDVAWTDVANSTSDDDFHILQVLPDTNEHFQAHQDNYTLSFVVPSVTCSNCILRVRYEAHKPGEHRFYQCADIAIKPASGPAPPTSNTVLYGIAFTELDWTASRSEYVSVDTTTGAINYLATFPFAVRSSNPEDTLYGATKAVSSPFILDQIAAYDASTDSRYFLGSSTGPVGAAPDRLVIVRKDDSETFDIRLKPLPTFAFPPNAIDFRPSSKQLVYLAIETYNATLGTYKCRIGTLDPESGSSSTLVYTDPDDTFVNSQWTALDADNDLYYLLMGNENDPVSLETRIYVVDLNAGNITRTVHPDFSQYTISSIFYYKKTGLLYTVSPGLVGGNTTWTLVTISPLTGAVTPVSVVGPAGLFIPYYGGTIFGFDADNGLLYYQFMVADQQTSLIATISLDTGKASYSGQSVMRHVHNLSFNN